MDDQHDEFPQSAAITLSLEELELDAASSRKKWNTTYNERRITASSSAAFSFSSGGSSALFNDDAHEASHSLGSLEQDGFLPSASERLDVKELVEYEDLDENLLSVDDKDMGDLVVDLDKRVKSEGRNPAPKSSSQYGKEKRKDLFAENEEEDWKASLNQLKLRRDGQAGVAERVE